MHILTLIKKLTIKIINSVINVIISKYKNIFAKGYTSNWSKEAFVIKEVKNTVPWTYVINDLNGEELLEHFIKKNFKKQIYKDLG